MPRALLPADLRQPATWLLSLTWAGRTFRLSSRPVVVVSDSPLGDDTYAYEGGLADLQIEQTLAILSDSPDQRSVSIEALLPVDVPAMIADGHDLASATGELALWLDGTTYEKRLVLVSGRVSQPEYGGIDEAIAFSLVEEPYDDTALIPGTIDRITTTTWPSAAEGALGAVYPIVFGAPGRFMRDGAEVRTAGSPALPIVYDATLGEADTLLIAGHRCVATEVYLWYATDAVDGTTAGPFTIVYANDGLGRECATIDVTAATAALRQAGEWWVSWSQGDAMVSPYFAGKGLTTAGEMIRYMADQGSLRWNRGRLQSAIGLGLRIDGYIDDQVVPWEWVTDNLLPVLPVSVTADDEGLFVVVWRHDARTEHAIDHLEVGPGIARVGRVEYDRKPHEIMNEQRIGYALNAASGDVQRQYILTPDRDAADPEQHTSAVVRSSALRYGGIRSERLDSDVIADDASAAYVAAWRAMAYGFASRLVTYEMGTERAWWDLGDVVTLTDAELALVDAVALVQSMTITDVGIVTVRLQILDDIETREVT